jgi:hypothetical protein
VSVAVQVEVARPSIPPRTLAAMMIMMIMVLIGWAALIPLVLLAAVAVCQAGHREDVARGFAAPV